MLFEVLSLIRVCMNMVAQYPLSKQEEEHEMPAYVHVRYPGGRTRLWRWRADCDKDLEVTKKYRHKARYRTVSGEALCMSARFLEHRQCSIE